MKLPQTNPRDDPSALWALQMELMSIAESVLGRRDLSKKVYQPQFTDYGPQLRNTRNSAGAFVELSRNGECYWPTVVFEMGIIYLCTFSSYESLDRRACRWR